jgi:hypothetical protein
MERSDRAFPEGPPEDTALHFSNARLTRMIRQKTLKFVSISAA